MEMSKLVELAKKNNAAAQKQLFSRLSDGMLLLCRRYVKSGEDAEEVMLDGWYRFFTTLSKFTYRNDAMLVAWIKKIMVNECLMLLRKKNALVLLAESDGEEVKLEEDVLSRLSAKEILELVLRLPAGYRTVFNLYEMEGFDHKEIASLLNITEGTSKSQLSRAKALLQRNLSERGNDYAKQNKLPHWKEKLSDIGMLLPEAALKKEVGWEVLHHRLQNRMKRRKARLYWVAAACLLPLFSVTIFFLFQNKSEGLQPVVHQSIITKPSPLFFDSSPKQKVVVRPETMTATKQTVSKRSSKKMVVPDHVEKPQIVATNSVVPEEAVVSPHGVDSITAPPALAIQQKKKLPVVHINELSEPVTTMPVIVQNGSRHYFPLQIAHGEVAGREIKTVRATGFINFKTASPTN